MAKRLKDKPLARNAGWSMQLTLYQDRARTTPVDLTGYTVQSQLRAEQSRSSTLLADITCTIAAGPTTGVVTLSLTQAQIEAIPAANVEGWADVLLGTDGTNPTRVCYWYSPIGEGETAWT